MIKDEHKPSLPEADLYSSPQTSSPSSSPSPQCQVQGGVPSHMWVESEGSHESRRSSPSPSHESLQNIKQKRVNLIHNYVKVQS